jgi:hypothetical protein
MITLLYNLDTVQLTRKMSYTKINACPEVIAKGFVRSNYKLHCFVCNQTIYRGDSIARCEEYGGQYSMTLRARRWGNLSFYTPDTGARWVHKNCNPNFWTTYNVIADIEETNKLMNEDVDYISSGLGIEHDPSLSLWTFIDKAYEVLDQVPLGDTMRKEIDYIKSVIAGKDIYMLE